MKKYQDTLTGKEWHFEQDVDIAELPNVPQTLTTIIIPRPSESHDWSNGSWAPNLGKAQAAQITALEDAYNTDIQLPVGYMGTIFQADDPSQAVLTKCLVAGSVPAGFYWLDANNIQVVMTFAQLQGLATAMLTQGQTAFVKRQTLKAQVRAATTLSAVQAVVW